MKRLKNIFCLLLVSIIMFSFVACSSKDSEDSKAESVITEYVNTYYTITKDDIDLYNKVMTSKDIETSISNTQKANERFKNLMADPEYMTRMSYGRCKQASENNYYVTVKNIKLEKHSEDVQTKVYYYDIELIQKPISGNEEKSLKEKRQITVSKIKDSWKVSSAYTDGY